ncbi:MAG: DUF4124 domain-containing protein [Alphaproteobacteria bacterium]|nr:DUF4124 domain-containing protein [Alphaproteobacteria bacterium]
MVLIVVLSPAARAAGPYPHFAQNSFWYVPVPRSALLDPKSPAYVDDFLRQLARHDGNVGINTFAYSSPIYVVGPRVATVRVTQWDCHSGHFDRGLAEQWASVPVPTYASSADGTDAEMTIYQPSTDRMWEFWRARHESGAWQACWGGRMDNVSTSDGIWPPHYGATATGLPFAGGEINVPELRGGAIHHVIGISLVELEHWRTYSWPANRSDGWNPKNDPNRIPEGTRFRLDPSINLNSLSLHPVARIIGKAAQTYGFVVWDKAGGISLRAENPKAFILLGEPNPYDALWNGTPSYRILAGFPWNRLQFLPKDYGHS